MLVSRGKEALAAAELYMDPLSLTKMDVKSKGKELSAATGLSADLELLEKSEESGGDDTRAQLEQEKGDIR